MNMSLLFLSGTFDMTRLPFQFLAVLSKHIIIHYRYVDKCTEIYLLHFVVHFSS